MTESNPDYGLFFAGSEVANAALKVWEVAVKKGMLFVIDKETGSDTLVGFFIPAYLVNDLGDVLAKLKRVHNTSSISSILPVQDEGREN